MATTKSLLLTLLEENQNGAEILVNEALIVLDTVYAGGSIPEASTPPGSPTFGDAYVIVPTATGAWVGQEGKLTIFWDGVWKFYAVPLPNHWSLVIETDTGRTDDGSKIYRRSYVLPAGPDGTGSGSSAVPITYPHGITGIQLAEPLWLDVSVAGPGMAFNVKGSATNAGNRGELFTFWVTATDIVWAASDVDMSGMSAHVRLEYART